MGGEVLKINLDNKFPDRLVLFIPGVSKKNIHKQWQPENFAKLAKYCESKKYTICVVGTEQDTSSIKPILNVRHSNVLLLYIINSNI